MTTSSRHEYPIVYFWYTRHKGRTIEWIIDNDPEYMMWAVKTFQDLTPGQAKYFKNRVGMDIKSEYIQDVEPYEWKKGDSEQLYIELCNTRDLQATINKWRPEQLSLF